MSLTKRIVLFIGLGGICAVVALVFVIYSKFHTFEIEDQIHDTFCPVAIALYQYQDEHGSPAIDLRQLVPKYVQTSPSSPLVDSVEYSVIDQGKAWQLSLHSMALSKPRIYCCRSTHEFTPDEKHRILLQYHQMWTVLSE